MSLLDRAAQFAPFAALTGHDAAIRENARLTEKRIELDEDAKSILTEKMQLILEFLDKRPEVTITYFESDRKKSGGVYVSLTSIVRKIDEYERVIIMADGSKISIEEICEIESTLFDRMLFD